MIHKKFLVTIERKCWSFLPYGFLLPVDGFKRLGDYEPDQFSDTRVHAPLARFQQAIKDLEKDIVDE